MAGQAGRLTVSSSAFRDGAPIPVRHACRRYGGEDVSPPLRIRDVPEGATSLALLFDDPDSPGDEPWVHWLLWDLPPDTVEIASGVTAERLGATPGLNSWGRADHGGPCPQQGTHRYRYTVYALAARVGLPAGATRAQFERAITNQVVAQGTLTGTFGAP